jgi:hypothetical protein
MLTELTKIRIPSASFCQLSTILLSSSSAALEYMEKNGPELSPNPELGSPCDDRFGLGFRFGAEIYLYVCETWRGQVRVKAMAKTHTCVAPPLEVMRSLRHFRDIA